MSRSLDDVVAAACTGAEWALSVLYREIQPGLLRYLHAQAPGHEEDLASEVWLQVARNMAGLEGGIDGFRRLVFTIARRRVIDHARGIARRRTEATDLDTMTSLAAPADTEAGVVERMDGHQAVDRVMELLPPDQAEVVLLRVIAGFTVPEVAQIIGRRPGAVSVLQHRGLRRLAALLGPEGTIDPVANTRNRRGT